MNGMENMETVVSGGVCAPEGFLAGAITCGIKRPDLPKKDLALIASETPCTAAAVFTKNQVAAPPVRLSRKRLLEGAPRAIVANSGNANAATGARGLEDAEEMCALAAAELGLAPEDIFVCSTGIIGKPMPMERIRGRFGDLGRALGRAGSEAAAEAIMTSDTRPKEFAVEIEGGIRIGGIAKGAGMIRPDMATMLAFLTTDAEIDRESLQSATVEAVNQSFNRITIDGDTSTNDTVIVLANGRKGAVSTGAFQRGLNRVMLELAHRIVADGERVTKFVTVEVQGGRTDGDARAVADAVANSNLCKASWNGEDPNWGRILHAVGYAKAEIREENVAIFFDDLQATRAGLATETPLLDLIAVVRQPRFRVTVDLGLGEGRAVVYSSDLSPEYVDFNRREYSLVNQKAEA
jgi:glutamate N-acetyltransferase/amino-acid N-acetyltransferase